MATMDTGGKKRADPPSPAKDEPTTKTPATKIKVVALSDADITTLKNQLVVAFQDVWAHIMPVEANMVGVIEKVDKLEMDMAAIGDLDANAMANARASIDGFKNTQDEAMANLKRTNGAITELEKRAKITVGELQARSIQIEPIRKPWLSTAGRTMSGWESSSEPPMTTSAMCRLS